MNWIKTFDPRRSLTTRLILVNLLVLLLALAGLVVWAGLRMQESQIEEAEHELELKALIVANGLQEPLANQLAYEDEQEAAHSQEHDTEEGNDQPQPILLAPFGDRNLKTIVDAYASEAEARITVLDTNLQVRYTSDADVPIYIEEQHPEIVAALQGKEQHDIRPDEWSDEERLFVGALIGDPEAPQGIVQLSVPMSRVMAKVRQTWLMLITAAGALGVMSIVASVMLGRQLTLPMRTLTRAAHQVAGGDFSVRLDLERRDELGALAKAFDHMANEISTRLERERAFVAHASHELRSPITSIQLRAELLQNNQVRDESRFRRYLNEIRLEAEHLAQLLEQLLDLNRLQSQAATDELPYIDPRPCLQRVMQTMAPLAHDAGLYFEQEIADELPWVRVAPPDLELVVRNLLDNAIKYTHPGGKVRATARASKGWLSIEVSDTGTGIPEQDLPHVFDRFYRVDKARDRQGSGLGLAMVKTMITEMGGEIELWSQLNEGTRVTIRLPGRDRARKK